MLAWAVWTGGNRTLGNLLRLGEGASIPGTSFIEKIRAADSGGRLSCQEAVMSPHELVIPHVHSREDEFTLLLQGRIGARVGGTDYELGPGDLLFKPRDVPHAMWNPSDEPAVSFEFISPAGFEEFFRETGRLEQSGNELTPSLFAELAARYGESIHPEWIGELSARYGVRL